MKKLVYIIPALLIIACGKNKKEETPEYTPRSVQEGKQAPALSAEAQKGKEIFEGKGNCISCHKTESKAIGPAVKDIATVYKQKNGDMVAFLKEKADPIVDPDQYPVMKTNLYLTKTFTDDELKALEAYFYSFSE
ncbi:c-type cytochrome [Flavobacterium rhizosphaerae]|uniref:C-type cytochrome n=1 Tax=Flavobacterium rhizosphaerae TaxID=3163298 RepID=A0ABW8YY80_9FLAO